MKQETEFLPGNNTDNESSEELTTKKAEKNKKLKNFAMMGGLGIGGAAIGATLMGFANPSAPDTDPSGGPSDSNISHPVIPDEIKEATSVSDNMSFNEAFASARDEVGPGGYFEWHGKPFQTYYKEEWTGMTDEQKQGITSGVMAEYNSTPHEPYNPIAQNQNDDIIGVSVVHDIAPVATHVTDEMAPGDAFIIARNEVGPGGVYLYHGQTYSTYLPVETNAMSDQQQQDFIDSAGGAEVVHPQIENTDDVIPLLPDADPSNNTGDIIPMLPVNDNENSGFSAEDNSEGIAEATIDFQVLSEDYIDDGEGGKIHIAMGMAESGEIVYKVDTDDNGTFDTALQFDESGNFSGFISDDGTQISADGLEDTVLYNDPSGSDVPADIQNTNIVYMEDVPGFDDSPIDYDSDADISDMV